MEEIFLFSMFLSVLVSVIAGAFFKLALGHDQLDSDNYVTRGKVYPYNMIVALRGAVFFPWFQPAWDRLTPRARRLLKTARISSWCAVASVAAYTINALT